MTTNDVLLIDLPLLKAADLQATVGGQLWHPSHGTTAIASAPMVIVAGLDHAEQTRQQLARELVAGPLERRLAGGLPVLFAGSVMDMLITDRSEDSDAAAAPDTDDYEVCEDDPTLTQWVVAPSSTTTVFQPQTQVSSTANDSFAELSGLDGTIASTRVITTWSFDAHPLFKPPTVLWSAADEHVLAIHNGPLTATCLDPLTGAGQTLVQSWVTQQRTS